MLEQSALSLIASAGRVVLIDGSVERALNVLRKRRNAVAHDLGGFP
jgi:hypothetical protein